MRFYCTELVCAIQYLHDFFVAYRDLKPENVLIAKSGHIKLADFGFSKIVKTRTWSVCGTREYISPEVVSGRGHGIVCDWWSLGVMVYEMIFGELPTIDLFSVSTLFSGGNVNSLKFKNEPHVDGCTKSFITELLQFDPAQRLGAEGKAVKSHSFFKGTNWKDVESLRLSPPFLPNISVNSVVHHLTRDTLMNMISMVLIKKGFKATTQTQVETHSEGSDDIRFCVPHGQRKFNLSKMKKQKPITLGESDGNKTLVHWLSIVSHCSPFNHVGQSHLLQLFNLDSNEQTKKQNQQQN